MVDKKSKIAFTDTQAVEFDRAFELLNDLVDLRDADKIHTMRHNAVYTTSVILWMLVYQRLKPDASLEAAVKHLLETRPSYLPNNKRLSDGTLSIATGGYSTARSRLPLEVVQWFAGEVNRAILATSKPLLGGRSIYLIDGTTIALAPEKELEIAFPPASNQHGEGVWPIALMTVFHELSSGCATLPEVGPMYGPNAVSETQLARQGIGKLPAQSVVMADSGFGIFGVAYEAERYGHGFLFRMNAGNFKSLCKHATLTSTTSNSRTYSINWLPTAKNRKTQPSLPADAVINATLHEIVVSHQLTLHIVTNLNEDAATVAELFKHRVQVEFDIRNLKVVMDTENIRAKRLDTFYKELYTSIVAYNLVGQFRRQAAEINEVEPRKMSFKRTWTTFQTFLLRHLHTDPKMWREAFVVALYYATKDKLPNRPGRTAKREAYQRRPKNIQFEKRKKPASKITPNDLK